MNDTPLLQIKFWFRQAHSHTLSLLEGLNNEQLAWQPHSGANSIAFYVWHLARSADYVQSHSLFEKRLAPRQQIWHSENLAAKWGLDPASLGQYELGWEMDPATATQMHWPEKAALLGYLQRAYAAEEEALAVLDDQLFQDVSESGKMLGHFLMEYLMHDWQHFGMMEYVKGLYELMYPDRVPVKKSARDKLPSVCPHCGGAINAETVTWVNEAEAKCPHCQGFIVTD